MTNNTSNDNFAQRGWNSFENEFNSSDETTKKFRSIAEFSHSLVNEIKRDSNSEFFEKELRSTIENVDQSLKPLVKGLDQELIKTFQVLSNQPRVNATGDAQNRAATHQNATTQTRTSSQQVSDFSSWLRNLKQENSIMYSGFLITLNWES